MATYSSILACRIPWTEEPGGLHTIQGGRKELDTTECTKTNQSEKLCFGKGSEAAWRMDWRRGKNSYVLSILCLGNTGAQSVPLC